MIKTGSILLPPNKFSRTVRFAFMLTLNERLALSKLAEIEGGLSDAAVLRRLIRQAASDHGMWPILDDPKTSDMGESEVPMEK